MSNEPAKRQKLSFAFSKVPVPNVEIPPDKSVVATNTAVYVLPPPLTKYGSGTPVAVLKAYDAQGPVVTISQTRKPSFTFGSDQIDGKPVGGYSYIGYTHVKSGDSTPSTGSFGYANDTRSAYNVKNGKLYPDRNKLSSVTTTNTTIAVPMSDLSGTWGETKIPTNALASNTNAIFSMPSFHEASTEAAGKIDIGGGDAVCLITTDKRLETEKSIVTSTLPYLPHLNKYMLLLNPPPSGKYGAVIADVTQVSPTRPLKITLQHVSKEGRTVGVEVWQSTLDEAGLDAKTLRVTPVIAYINASLDAWSGETKLMMAAFAAPPPDLTGYVAFAKAPALKSFFNDLGHSAEEAKSRESSVDQLLMNESRAVPLKFARVGVANTLLLEKPAAVALVRAHAASMAREQADCKGVLDVVKAVDDDDVITGLLGIDRVPGSVAVENLLQKINAQMDDAAESEHAGMVCAATFLHALLAGGKATVEGLRPMVYGYKPVGGDDEGDDESDFEADGEEDEDFGGNL